MTAKTSKKQTQCKVDDPRDCLYISKKRQKVGRKAKHDRIRPKRLPSHRGELARTDHCTASDSQLGATTPTDPPSHRQVQPSEGCPRSWAYLAAFQS